MKTHLIVSYDLMSPGQHYRKVAVAIKSLGEWTKVLESLWYVCTERTLEDTVKIIWASMDSNDKLFVAEVSNAVWRNLHSDPEKFIMDHGIVGDTTGG